jgi:uncharacterized cupredoxin-like copper-binding protein
VVSAVSATAFGESPCLRPQRLLSLAGLSLLAVLGVGASISLSTGSADATGAASSKPTGITVTLSDAKVKLSRSSVAAGTTVVFTIRNTAKAAHTFRVNGKVTPRISSGTSRELTVKFFRQAKLSYVALVPGHASAALRGTFRVAPAVKPTTTAIPTTTAPPTKAPGPGGNIAVTLTDTVYTFTPTKIPAGDVTFTMPNTGTASHNLDIKGVTGGVGPVLASGQTATITVNLAAGQTYTFVCDVPGHGAQQGTFVSNF